MGSLVVRREKNDAQLRHEEKVFGISFEGIPLKADIVGIRIKEKNLWKRLRDWIKDNGEKE